MMKRPLLQSSYTPWLVCLGAALFFYFAFFQLVMFNTISKAVMHDFHINTIHVGYLSSTYFFADALAIIPAGLLLDRYSIRKVVLVAMSLCVISVYVFASTHDIYTALIARAIAGFSNAFAFLSSMQLAARWLPSKRLALGIGLIITIIMIGGIIAQTPLALLVQAVGWRGAMLVNASLGLVFLLYMFYILQDKPETMVLTTHIDDTATVFSKLWISMKKPQNWLCSGYTAFMNVPISLLGELWGIMYLTQTRHLSMTTATNITSMMFIGMIIGSPSMGWLSDKIQRRQRPMFIAACFILLIVLAIAYLNIHSIFVLGLLFFLLGLLSSAQVLSYPTMAESNTLAMTGTALSIVAIMLNLVSFFAQPLFGWLMHTQPVTYNAAGKIMYSSASFEIAMIILPVAFVISLVIAWYIRETHCLPYDEKHHASTNNPTLSNNAKSQ